MKAFLKTKMVGVKLPPVEHALARRAARLETKRRGERVTMSDLFREAALPVLDRIVNQPTEAVTVQVAPQNV